MKFNYVHEENGLKYAFITEENYITEINKLIDEVYESIENKIIFQKDDEKELLKAIRGEGAVLVGIYLDDELVGYRYANMVKYEESYANLIDTIEIPKDDIIIHQSVMVKEKARGRDAQNVARKVINNLLEKKGYYQSMSTVSPENIPSLRNVLKLGFNLVALRLMYKTEEHPEGKLRYIWYKNNKSPLKVGEESLKIEHTDYEKVESALKSGYVGKELIEGETNYIVFRKLTN